MILTYNKSAKIHLLIKWTMQEMIEKRSIVATSVFFKKQLLIGRLMIQQRMREEKKRDAWKIPSFRRKGIKNGMHTNAFAYIWVFPFSIRINQRLREYERSRCERKILLSASSQ